MPDVERHISYNMDHQMDPIWPDITCDLNSLALAVKMKDISLTNVKLKLTVFLLKCLNKATLIAN